MADSRNDLGDLVSLPSDLEVDFWTWWRWMQNKALSPKYIEDEYLSSIFAYVMLFENPHSMARIQSEIEVHRFLLFWVWYLMQQV